MNNSYELLSENAGPIAFSPIPLSPPGNGPGSIPPPPPSPPAPSPSPSPSSISEPRASEEPERPEDLAASEESQAPVRPMESAPAHRVAPSSPLHRTRLQKFGSLIINDLIRWIITLLLIAGFYLAVHFYENRILHGGESKSYFDFIIVALSIALGLNVASALKAVALDFRWWILSRKRRPEKEVDLILCCDSLTELVKLAATSQRPRTMITCAFWVAFNIAAQVIVAIIPLTFSIDAGISDIYLLPGLNSVSRPNMTSFMRESAIETNGYWPEASAAHTLGVIGTTYNFSSLPATSLYQTPWASNTASFWNATDHWEYVFLDTNPFVNVSGPNFQSVYSDRIVSSSAVCTTPPFTSNYTSTLTYVYGNKGTKLLATFPSMINSTQSIYYLTIPFLSLEDSTQTGYCGPGCSRVQAAEDASNGASPGYPNTWFYYYDCNITVRSTTADNTISPRFGAVAAQAIALSGQVHNEFSDFDDHYNDEYVAYNFGASFGTPQNNSAVGMQSLMAQYAIGVVAAAAQTNPTLIGKGGQPVQGLRLTVMKPFAFTFIFVFIAVVQLILGIVVSAVVSKVDIPKGAMVMQSEEIARRFLVAREGGGT